jgi:hypothetical protein
MAAKPKKAADTVETAYGHLPPIPKFQNEGESKFIRRDCVAYLKEAHINWVETGKFPHFLQDCNI